MALSPSSPQNSPTLPVAVIGGGVTGLAAAYQLTKLGRPVRLFEASQRLGGAVRTERTDGWLIEAGPNTLQENSRAVAELIRELGLDGERVVANTAAKNRFLVRDGNLRAVPRSPGTFLTTPLFSFATKLRIATEVFKRPRRRPSDVSLADLIRDHFGQEVVDYALNPFVSGVYAGDPRKLSARRSFPSLWEAEQRHGSLIRGLMARGKTRKAAGHPKSQIISFRTGLQALVDALSAKLPDASVQLNAKIEGLVPGSPWRLVWTANGETRTDEFSAVILAAPASALAQFTFGSLGERPLALLDAIEHPPVASVFLGFRRDHMQHPLDGFGALIPAAENRALLGVLFSSSLFPDRAPEGHVAFTAMVGGSVRPKLAGKSQDEIEAAILPELSQLLGITGPPVFRRLNVWPRAIPQYQIGYERFLDAMADCEKRFPGLHIGGNVRDGISLPNCLESGLALAARTIASG